MALQFPKDDTAFLSPKQYASLFGIHENTVFGWLKAKRIEGIQPGGPRGRWFIPKTEAEKLMRYQP